MTRSEEIKRLEQYAKGLGADIIYRKHERGNTDGAYIVVLNTYKSQVVVFKDSRTTKKELVLNIIHELGHLLSWIYNGRQDPKELIEALQAESERKNQVIPKDKRKLIYEMEKHDTKYWDYIVTELGINISKNELKARKLLDIWIYRMYYLKGEFPSLQKIREKKEELMRKYAEKERAKSRRILQREIKRSAKADKRFTKTSKNVGKNWAYEKTKKSASGRGEAFNLP